MTVVLVMSLVTNGVFISREVHTYIAQHQLEDILDDQTPMGAVNGLDAKSVETIQKISALEKSVQSQLGLTDKEKINNATMALLRRNRYGHYTSGGSVFLWLQFAGGIQSECGVNMAKAEAALEEALKDTDSHQTLIDPVNHSAIDLIHMIAVVDVNYTDVDTDEFREVYYDYLLSWGGDLETLRINLSDYFADDDVEDFEAYYQYAIETLGSDVRSYFSKEDMLADVDGVNLADLMRQDLLLSEALMQYYTGPAVANRNQLFVNHYGGQGAFEKEVFAFMFNGVGSRFEQDEEFQRFMEGFKGLKSMMFQTFSDRPVLDNQLCTNALSNAFIDKIGQSY